MSTLLYGNNVRSGFPVDAQNLILGPDFNVLPGTHTNAILRNNTANTKTNSCLLGWQIFTTAAGSPDVYVAQDTTGVLGPRQCSKITVANAGNGVGMSQLWDSTEYLYGAGNAQDKVSPLRGKYLPFAVDLKLDNAGITAYLDIITDGTGGTTTSSAAHTGTTAITRVIVPGVLVPTDATSIEFRVRITVTAGTGIVYAGLPMCVPTVAPILALPFVPRLPIDLEAFDEDTSTKIQGTQANNVTWLAANSASWATKSWDVNTYRPAWANGCFVHSSSLQNTGSGMTVQIGIRRKGFNNQDLSIAAYSSSGAFLGVAGVAKFGDDALFDLFANTGATAGGLIYLFSNGWFGKGL